MTPTELQALQASVAQQFAAKQWRYADKDPAAMAEIKARIEKYIRGTRTVSYSNLVYKVVFNLPSFNQGKPYIIDVNKWNQAASTLIGEFLCYISMESFINHGYLSSTLVVSNELKLRRPSKGFFELSRELGLLGPASPIAAVNRVKEEAFWQAENSYVFDPSTVLNRVAPFV
jgi:hypothetical protein